MAPDMAMWAHFIMEQQNVRRTRICAELGLWVLLGVPGCIIPTAPLHPSIEAEWLLAQQFVGPGAERVFPEMFRWEQRDGPFDCGGLANGCFRPPRLIQWNTRTPNVIRHEACHAILYQLGRPWRHREGACEGI